MPCPGISDALTSNSFPLTEDIHHKNHSVCHPFMSLLLLSSRSSCLSLCYCTMLHVRATLHVCVFFCNNTSSFLLRLSCLPCSCRTSSFCCCHHQKKRISRRAGPSCLLLQSSSSCLARDSSCSGRLLVQHVYAATRSKRV